MVSGLSVRDLLTNTYDELKRRHNFREVIFPSGDNVYSVIASDSNGCSDDIEGFMEYNKIGLFELNNNKWVLGNGFSYGKYPAEPYNSDLLAMNLNYDDKSNEEIKNKFEFNVGSYFKNSIIVGMKDGTLRLPKRSRFNDEMIKFFENEEKIVKEYVSRVPSFNRKYISPSTFSSVCTYSMQYKSEFVYYLTDSIEKTLSEF